MQNKGLIYILSIPSSPESVKIGYTEDVTSKLQEINSTLMTTKQYKLFAYYKVSAKLTDKRLHDLFDWLYPYLLNVEVYNGKNVKREYYLISPEEMYFTFKILAEINGLKKNLVLVDTSAKDSVKEFEKTRLQQLKEFKEKELKEFEELGEDEEEDDNE